MRTFSRARHWLLAGLCATLALSAGAASTGAANIGSIIEFGFGNTPSEIAAGPDGNVWFIFPGGIGRINPKGEITRTWPLAAGAGPWGIAAGPDGNLWFTESGSGLERIGRISPSGDVTGLFLILGADPHGIAAGPDGNLWYTAPGPDAIGRINPDGVPSGFFPVTPAADPSAITNGPDGNLWFTEPGTNSIGRITPAGAVTEFPLPSASAYPSGIAAGLDGNLWFTEYSANRIGRITPAGVISEFSAGLSDGAGPWGIATGPDGNLWFTENSGNGIGRITPAGVISEFSAGLSDGAGPWGIAAGPDGDLWFTENSGNRIGKAVLVPSNETTVTATVESAIQISATPLVDFGQVAVGATKLGVPTPASVVVMTNDTGYTLSVTRSPFSRGADIPLSLGVSAPGGTTSPLSGLTAIPTSGSLTVGSRSGPPPLAGDEWRPVYQLGPVPLRPAGATAAVVTYTAVAA